VILRQKIGSNAADVFLRSISAKLQQMTKIR